MGKPPRRWPLELRRLGRALTGRARLPQAKRALSAIFGGMATPKDDATLFRAMMALIVKDPV